LRHHGSRLRFILRLFSFNFRLWRLNFSFFFIFSLLLSGLNYLLGSVLVLAYFTSFKGIFMVLHLMVLFRLGVYMAFSGDSNWHND